MKKYTVCITNYGFAEIEAENEEEALGKVDSMKSEDFNWSCSWTHDDASIVDEEEVEE